MIAGKALSALFACLVVGVPIALIPLSSVGATDECLTTPKGEIPQGKHWYYRSERSTQRRCWYLRDEGEASPQAATSSTPPRRATPELAPNEETTLPRSTADAHAELPQDLVAVDSATPATSVDPTGADRKSAKSGSPGTAQASRRSKPAGGIPSSEPISPSFVVAPPVPDTNSDSSAGMAMTPAPAPVGPTKVETSSIATPASLRILLLGTFSAIALSWLTGSAMMARMRRRPRRHTSSPLPKWPTERPANHNGKPLSPEPMPVNSIRALDADRKSFGRPSSGPGDNVREIEQLLARFANQAQAES